MNLIAQETRPDTSYRLIPLTQGQFAIVNAVSYEWLMGWKWYARWSPKTRSFYAQRAEKRRVIQMHRVILGIEYGDPREGDHINRNTLDNRLSNLRSATHSQNMQNAKVRSDSRTGLKGVTRNRGRWQARIVSNGKRMNLGFYATPEEAYAAYCEAAPRLHGEFARF